MDPATEWPRVPLSGGVFHWAPFWGCWRQVRPGTPCGTCAASARGAASPRAGQGVLTLGLPFSFTQGQHPQDGHHATLRFLFLPLPAVPRYAREGLPGH
jgi:hypothetical protein